MRGEETLCFGLKALGRSMPLVVLNLGSHWKAIQMNVRGEIALSVTTLSGELIHAAQTQTVLASSVPKEPPRTLAESWVQAGMTEQRRSGLPRAIFCVRLLELAKEGTAEDRLAFLIGAFIAADLDALHSCGMLAGDGQIVIAGPRALAHAWRNALRRASRNGLVLSAAKAEEGLLTGLRSIVEQAKQRDLRSVKVRRKEK
jgi:2-dehydro-3-deoxygalactonokinase